MVGPSISEERRRGLNLRIKVGFVVMVAVSGALTGVWADGSPSFVAGGAVGGAVLGAVLIQYLSWLAREAREKSRTRTRRPSWSPGEDQPEDGATDGGEEAGDGKRSPRKKRP